MARECFALFISIPPSFWIFYFVEQFKCKKLLCLELRPSLSTHLLFILFLGLITGIIQLYALEI